MLNNSELEFIDLLNQLNIENQRKILNTMHDLQSRQQKESDTKNNPLPESEDSSTDFV